MCWCWKAKCTISRRKSLRSGSGLRAPAGGGPPGPRRVVDGLEVVPPQVDSDAEIEEALRLVFEANPVLNPDQIRISSRASAITLDGHVATDAEKALAELDAWYLFGVDKVENRLQVIK